MSFQSRETSTDDGEPIHLYRFERRSLLAGLTARIPLTDAAEAITVDGVTYAPWPIQMEAIRSAVASRDREIKVRLARGTELDQRFQNYPPADILRLVVFQGHAGEAPIPANYPLAFSGRITAGLFSQPDELELGVVPTRSSLARVGLRRNYQLACPHVLYGDKCKAVQPTATVERSVSAVGAKTLSVAELGTDLSASIKAALDARSIPYWEAYRGGVVQWVKGDGFSELRTIVSIQGDGTVLGIRGPLTTVEVGDTVSISLGCNRRVEDCRDLHGNIGNFGGQPWIPLENPLSERNNFY